MGTDQNKNSVDIITLINHTVIDEQGQLVKIGSLWKDQPIMMIFLRHFACIACRALASQIWNEKEKYQKAGAKIVFIGNGAANFIKGFKDDLKISDAPVYTDPSLVSFKACGFKRGFLAALGPKSIMDAMKLSTPEMKNKFPVEGSGDYWQLGGVVVLKADGKVAYHYISQSLGDYPEDQITTQEIKKASET